jgi:Protein of unknown function (DUF559)
VGEVGLRRQLPESLPFFDGEGGEAQPSRVGWPRWSGTGISAAAEGIPFRRQTAIDDGMVDRACCAAPRLIVEVDGQG